MLRKLAIVLLIAGCGGDRMPDPGGSVGGGGEEHACDGGAVDADDPADLATRRVGNGDECTTSCDCDAVQHLVCFQGRCRDGTLVNAGHPVTQAFACCSDLTTCTPEIGCQLPSGAVQPCAGTCGDVTCSSQFDCGNAGCPTACDPVTMHCS